MLTAAGSVRVYDVLETVIRNTMLALTPDAGKLLNPKVLKPPVGAHRFEYRICRKRRDKYRWRSFQQ